MNEGDLFPRDRYVEEILPALDLDSIKQDLMEFTGFGAEEIERRALTSMDELSAEWQAAKPTMNTESVCDIYRKTNSGYLYTWAMADRYRFSKYSKIRPYLKGQTLLDYGTATGCMALFAARLDGFSVCAADLDTPYFGFAKYRFKKYGVCSALNLDEEVLPEHEFDTVLLLDVLEHVVEWRNVLKKCVRSMVEGGRIILMVSFALYEDGELHISDRTGLTRESLASEMNGLGLCETVVDGHIQVFQKYHAGAG